LVGYQEEGSEAKVSLGGADTVPHTNTRFSLVHNDIHSSIHAVGSCVEFPSFIQKQRMRMDNASYNIEAAFYAAMNMLDKRVEFRYIPHHYMNINEIPVHFCGEPNQHYRETIIEGDVHSNKFIVWYVWGEEIVGFVTVGYTNLHLYLLEAMKLLVMPTAVELRKEMTSHKSIVARVLKCRPEIIAKRKE